MIDMKKVGEQISSLRKNKGLTQNELGERLGVSFPFRYRLIGYIQMRT